MKRSHGIIPLLALALAACSHKEPGIEIRTVTKVVETQKPCPGTVPERPAKLGAIPADPVSALAIVAAKLAAYSGPGMYADQAEAYFETCPSQREVSE